MLGLGETAVGLGPRLHDGGGSSPTRRTWVVVSASASDGPRQVMSRCRVGRAGGGCTRSPFYLNKTLSVI